eukprot:1288150-Amphidinium_carterae.1
MVKFNLHAPVLRQVGGKSTIRPTGLPTNDLLRLEALGVPREVFTAAQAKWLKRLSGPVTPQRGRRIWCISDDDDPDQSNRFW